MPGNKRRNDLGKGARYHAAHWLQVGEFRIWTTLSKDDLRDPDLWKFRTPRAWAAAIAATQARPDQKTPREQGAERGPRGGGPELFNPRNGALGIRKQRAAASPARRNEDRPGSAGT